MYRQVSGDTLSVHTLISAVHTTRAEQRLVRSPITGRMSKYVIVACYLHPPEQGNLANHSNYVVLQSDVPRREQACCVFPLHRRGQRRPGTTGGFYLRVQRHFSHPDKRVCAGLQASGGKLRWHFLRYWERRYFSERTNLGEIEKFVSFVWI